MVNVLVMLYKCANQVSGESVMCTVDLPAWSSGGLSLKIISEIVNIWEFSLFLPHRVQCPVTFADSTG